MRPMAARSYSTSSLAVAAGFGLAVAAVFGALGGRRELPRDRILRIARGELGETDRAKYTRDVLGKDYPVSWCGIWVTWVLQHAGIPVTWDLKGGTGLCPSLPATDDPEPGDLVSIPEPFQHLGIVESVNPDGSVTTLDGNSVGRAVARNVRRDRENLRFLSLGRLLRAEV